MDHVSRESIDDGLADQCDQVGDGIPGWWCDFAGIIIAGNFLEHFERPLDVADFHFIVRFTDDAKDWISNTLDSHVVVRTQQELKRCHDLLDVFIVSLDSRRK